MSKLDQALEKYIEDDSTQAAYYDLILNSKFYLPVQADSDEGGEQEVHEDAEIVPLILELDGAPFLPLFDSAQRLNDWAKEPVSYVVLPGDVVADLTPPQLSWALNLGSGFHKQFAPDEIGWIKEIVLQLDEMVQE